MAVPFFVRRCNGSFLAHRGTSKPSSRKVRLAKNQNTFEKRRREVEKRQRAEEKRKRRVDRKASGPEPTPRDIPPTDERDA